VAARRPGKQSAETGFFSSYFLQRRDLQNNKETQQHRQLILFFLDPVPSGLSQLDLLHCRSVSSGHLLPLTGSENHCHLQKEKNTQGSRF
jgi:hypothetical protein